MSDNEEVAAIPIHVIRRILSYGTRKQKTGSVEILADDTEPATTTESTKADRLGDRITRRSLEQNEVSK